MQAQKYLPTTAELKNLYLKKGHDSLIWYSWRNALRILPLLGYQPLNQVWKENITKSYFSLIRAHLLIAQWPDRKNKNNTLKSIESIDEISKIIHRDVLDSANLCTEINNENISNTINITAKAIITLKKSMRISDDVYMASALSIFTIKDVLSAEASEQFRAAAKADFTYLMNTEKIEWMCRPLWSKSEDFYFKPLDLDRFEKNLTDSLKENELDFLAEDLEVILNGGNFKSHVGNYFLNLSDSITKDPIALRYAISHGEESEPVKAVRIFLLGSGGAGKTSLAKCLKGEKPTINQATTLGIDYQNNLPINLYNTLPHLNLDPIPLDMYIWDFGGQAIFHGMHRTFLHENCVYILVVDNRHEQAPEEWLYQIGYLAAAGAKILLVTNQYENCNTRQNENRLLRKFKGALSSDSFFYFSCFDPNDDCFRNFANHLIKKCLDSRKDIFSSTLKYKEKLFDYYKSDFFIYERNLKKLINENEQKIELILNQLKELGFLFLVKNNSKRFFIKPEWILEYTYRILYSDIIRKNKGLLTIDELEKILKDELEQNHIEYLIDLLEDRDLCCSLSNGSYFFPDASPESEPYEIEKLMETNEQVALDIYTNYLPLGFHARLVRSLFESYLMHEKDIWRNGFIMHSEPIKKTKYLEPSTDRKLHNSASFDEDYEDLMQDNTNQPDYLNKAIVTYNLRKDSISIILIGDVKSYQNILEIFLLELGKIINIDKTNISVKIKEDSFSTHSSKYLIKFFERINNYSQLIAAVRNMSSKQTINNFGDTYHGDRIEIINPENSNLAIKSENFSQNTPSQSVEITADQRQQLAILMTELLKSAPEGEELVTIGTVQKALKTPNEPKSRNILGKVFTSIKDFSVFAKDTGLPLAEKIAEHKDAIIGAMTAVATSI